MLLVPLLLSPLLSLSSAPPPQGGRLPSDSKIERAWSYLHPDEKREIAEWLRLELGFVRNLQTDLVNRARELVVQDLGFWPDRAPAPTYDPEVHAPAQPIRRRPLDSSDSAAERASQRILKAFPERDLDVAWEYDWASRGLVRVADPDDPERIFRNAMRGYTPDLDLAEALVLRELDNGTVHKILTAFAHAYTDRSGNVYPGITLYDAWASGAEIEMPDVDTLGIVHDVLDEWNRWKAPVSNQRELYETIGELFVRAHRYRGLRVAMARTYLCSEPVMRDGYGKTEEDRVRLHALWARHNSDPKQMASVLPSPEGWETYLSGWALQSDKRSDLFAAGEERMKLLRTGEQAVKAKLVWVLEEFGAFDRRRLPHREPPKPPAKPPEGGEQPSDGRLSPIRSTRFPR